ncbi:MULTISPECIES: hypothetical protein [unclassified Microcoleus]|uniref:hypothetical protein n=1 Tax=unclassified Microcoleus TaxID=2642155 RepID=UPI002FD74131
MNLRLDGRQDLLEAIKGMAATEGLSVNAWVVRTLESAVSAAPISAKQTLTTSTETDIEPVLDSMLDKKLDRILDTKLDKRLDNFEERLGKLSA